MSLLQTYQDELLEAGCDEAGRGCIAGPVVAASVILPNDFFLEDLNDSKQLSEKKRLALKEIIEREALAWSVFFVDHEEVDKMNVLNASIHAMKEAACNLKIKPELLLIDGNRFKQGDIPHVCIIKGDGKYMSIAAASVLAKTHRDAFMLKMSLVYPNYKWEKNKGYPTKDHCAGIEKYGYSPLHRKSFHVKSLYQSKLELLID